jgi:hypothetical protein
LGFTRSSSNSSAVSARTCPVLVPNLCIPVNPSGKAGLGTRVN